MPARALDGRLPGPVVRRMVRAPRSCLSTFPDPRNMRAFPSPRVGASPVWRLAALAATACLASGALRPAAAQTSSDSARVQVRRPSIQLTTTERFDAKSVPAYRGRHAKAYSYIDAHKAEH